MKSCGCVCGRCVCCKCCKRKKGGRQSDPIVIDDDEVIMPRDPMEGFVPVMPRTLGTTSDLEPPKPPKKKKRKKERKGDSEGNRIVIEDDEIIMPRDPLEGFEPVMPHTIDLEPPAPVLEPEPVHATANLEPPISTPARRKRITPGLVPPAPAPVPVPEPAPEPVTDEFDPPLFDSEPESALPAPDLEPGPVPPTRRRRKKLAAARGKKRRRQAHESMEVNPYPERISDEEWKQMLRKTGSKDLKKRRNKRFHFIELGTKLIEDRFGKGARHKKKYAKVFEDWLDGLWGRKTDFWNYTRDDDEEVPDEIDLEATDDEADDEIAEIDDDEALKDLEKRLQTFFS